jgi:hypothetical protein
MDILLSTKITNGKLDEPFTQRDYIDPYHVCPDCQTKYLTKGVLLIDPKTASLAVITDEAFQKTFTIPIPTGKIALIEESLLKQIGALPCAKNSTP